MNIFQILALVQSIFSVVHAVQAAMPASPGRDKSAAVLDKVAPVVDAIGAQAGAVQTIIDTAVTVYKSAGVWTQDEAPNDVSINVSEALGAGQIAP